MGAITRGQRQTGGQGLFRPEDNLESPFARDALRQLYLMIVRGGLEGCSLDQFEAATGLKLMDENGIRDDLPPITTFLNRLLALTIGLQGVIFAAFETLLTARIEGAMASGSYDMGLETLRAESFRITDAGVIHTHPGTGAETRLLTITQRQRNRPMMLSDALSHLADPAAKLLINSRSGRAAVQSTTYRQPRIRHVANNVAMHVRYQISPNSGRRWQSGGYLSQLGVVPSGGARIECARLQVGIRMDREAKVWREGESQTIREGRWR